MHIARKIEAVIGSFFGWLIFVPLSIVIPKQHNLVLFYGNRFADNIKYLYSYVHSNRDSQDVEYYFLTKKAQVFNELHKADLPVLRFPSLKACIKILRTKVLVVDNMDWIYHGRFYLFFKSYKVQLWHGIGMKQIEKDFQSEKLWSKIFDFLTGRFPRYDLLVSTCDFYSQNRFRSAFNVDKIVEFGYPRTDIFLNPPDSEIYIGTDLKIINRVRKYKDDQYRIVLYAPTFRDSGGNAIEEGLVDLEKLSKNAVKNREIWVIKFHPVEKINCEWEKITNLILYARNKDIYPLLPIIDLLITDYSSIYMDFLLLGKPVVFFPYDYAKYIKEDRKLQFDYDWMTPGPKCYTQDDLEQNVRTTLAGEDPKYKKRREELIDLVFKHQDGNAAARIWEYIQREVLKSRA
jgi:CDP-glycerol glycerophosphotransferase (TagB/SpsB family)